MRHADDDMSQPVTIESGPVRVNHWGVVACRQEIDLDEFYGNDRYTNLTDQESMYFASIASQDRHSDLILETEAVTYYAEDMEPDDDEEEYDDVDKIIEELREEALSVTSEENDSDDNDVE
jgi:hypothetical protein